MSSNGIVRVLPANDEQVQQIYDFAVRGNSISTHYVLMLIARIRLEELKNAKMKPT